MKRRFAAAALAAMTLMTSLALAGCSSDEQNQAGEGQSADLLEQIRDRGELIIATEGTWAPWTYHDEEDDPAWGSTWKWPSGRPKSWE